MNEDEQAGSVEQSADVELHEIIDPVGYDFGLNRRGFMQFLSAGLLIASSVSPALAQRSGGGRRGGGGGARNIAARVHLGKDGSITVLTGKVECGQGSRAELTQAAAEELRVAPERIKLLMADTSLAPNDGITAGSGSTPRTVPAVRQGAAAARQVLLNFASKRWGVPVDSCEIRDGRVFHPSVKQPLDYADIARDEEASKLLNESIPTDISLTPVKGWKVLGKPFARPNRRDIVTGAHRYPSDIHQAGMMYGKVLRAPSYGAKLISVDLGPARAMKDVLAVQDDQFVGVAAPSTFKAEQALAAVASTAKWETAAHPSSNELFEYLKQNASGGIPENPFAQDVAKAKQKLRCEYQVAYVQHAPLEPRVAVAEWKDGKITVWAATQNPFGHASELARAFHLTEGQARVIVPDFGGGFGGKHTGEASVEAARLAKAAGKPVSLRWTREEEFTWANFRPAALIQAEASLEANGSLASWYFININSGGSAIETPYRVQNKKSQFIRSKEPLRHGSYRALAATANTFARECFMDELAAETKTDPLEFRLAHLENGRLSDVLEVAAKRFDWKSRAGQRQPNIGVGLACGTEKGSYVACCAEIELNRNKNNILVRHVCQVFECGAILDPENLISQVEGAIIMGLGPALREEMRFENGKMLNATFGKYQPPRFDDIPELDIHLLDRPDLPSFGGGETPIIAVAPAIANALFRITNERVRSMPIRLPGWKSA